MYPHKKKLNNKRFTGFNLMGDSFFYIKYFEILHKKFNKNIGKLCDHKSHFLYCKPLVIHTI